MVFLSSFFGLATKAVKWVKNALFKPSRAKIAEMAKEVRVTKKAWKIEIMRQRRAFQDKKHYTDFQVRVYRYMKRKPSDVNVKVMRRLAEKLWDEKSGYDWDYATNKPKIVEAEEIRQIDADEVTLPYGVVGIYDSLDGEGRI